MFFKTIDCNLDFSDSFQSSLLDFLKHIFLVRGGEPSKYQESQRKTSFSGQDLFFLW